MSVFAVSQADSTQVANLQPFADSGSDNSFIPSMVSVDPENNRVYVMDAGAGMLAGVDLSDGALSVAWSQEQTTLSFTSLIGPADQRVLIGTDIPIERFRQLQSYTTEAVVWRDAATGNELARSSELPKMTQGILVTPGYAGVQYFLTADGHIIGLQVAPEVSGS
jgi:DNA-binding beta-propeller fold protein YncE